ncbi:MAG: DUF4173 domain-containing protein [Planctomycetes bacterium]|nr:DUF4173 domain-containing protein [Planctomycetota bacterium]
MAGDGIVSAEVVDSPAGEPAPVRWRELLTVVILVALADIAIYRGHGFAGWAVCFAAVPWAFLFGAPRSNMRGLRCHRPGAWTVGLLLTLLTIRMVWQGSPLQVAVGLVLVAAVAVSFCGVAPTVFEVAVFPARMMLGGLLGLAEYRRSVRGPEWRLTRLRWLSVVFPLVTFLAFGVLFVLANPDLLASFGRHVEQLLRSFREFLIRYSPHPTEILFWLAMAWVVVGMLRPVASKPLFGESLPDGKRFVTGSPAPLYAACRNTLITVIVLFAIYLVFEFQTLWFRTFPAGFYYSGYAHQGAAWLTVALALATVVLSLVFRGAILREPRLKSLRRLAWLWSLENVLLAVAVYHRLFIYIGFNGMTRMRVVGLLGISAVLVGFLLVVWKIARHHSFLWLVHRHLWTVAFAVYLFAVAPVDAIVVRYNVDRILAGDPAPSVQITEHPISWEGVLLLAPLVDCDNPLIREGVRAHLAERWEQAAQRSAAQQQEGWTSFQMVEHLVLRQLGELDRPLDQYADPGARAAAWGRFREYAYQWY